MNEVYVYLANESSEFDTGTIVQLIDQPESGSYFRGVGLVKGEPKILDRIFFDDIEFVRLSFEDLLNPLQELADQAQELDMGY